MGAPLGNKNSTADKRAWGDTLRKIAVQNNGARLHKVAETLFDLAESGDVGAIREIGDRIDGKPKQELEHSGDLIVNIAPPDASA